MADLKPPAARMRYTRLAKAIESGTLIGKKNTPFQGGSEKINEASKKRKKTAFDSDDDDERSQKPLLGKGRQLSEAGTLYEESNCGKNALGDKADGTPAAKKVTKLTKIKAATEGGKADGISAGTDINGPKSAKPKILPFTVAKASPNIDLPSSDIATAIEAPSTMSYNNTLPANQTFGVPEAKNRRSISGPHAEPGHGAVTNPISGNAISDLKSDGVSPSLINK
jgi:hypothetical protein